MAKSSSDPIEQPKDRESGLVKDPHSSDAQTSGLADDRIVMSESNEDLQNVPSKVPVLALRDVVIYPFMVFPVLVGRESSLSATTAAVSRDKYIFLVVQRDSQVEDPGVGDLNHHGTLARITRIVRLPNGLMKVLVDGLEQAVGTKFTKEDHHLEASVEILRPEVVPQPELEALVRYTSDLFRQYVKQARTIPPEVLVSYEGIVDPRRKLFYIAAYIAKEVAAKQKLLEMTNIREQFLHLTSLLTVEIDILKLEQELDEKVQQTIQKSQRKYFLSEQIRVLQQELGEDVDEQHPELGKLVRQLEEAKLPKLVRERSDEELQRLRKTPAMSPEAGVIRTYLEWIAGIPWSKRTDDQLNLKHVQSVLNHDHYGLEKAKNRILEYIAVLNLVPKIHGQILCLVGPPGVGKTSLAKSIASALGREFVRISLGGVRDEAEIRGHRRTYIGALPGKIIQSMKRAGVVNPLILLDEVDKMTMDFRGDPSSALLEVLDPEQNSTFTDHYIEVEYDLSNAFFITTANVKYNIPHPLLDRMEVIEIPGYLEHDKLEIAKRHIIPDQLKAHGLPVDRILFDDAAVLRIIRHYTEEAGVRNLVREVARICRRIAREIVTEVAAKQPKPRKTKAKAQRNVSSAPRKIEVMGIANADAFELKGESVAEERKPAIEVPESYRLAVTEKDIEKYLGVPRFRLSTNELTPKIGEVMGLAWTSSGGDVLPVEAEILDGAERLTLTGQLGDVMKESAQAALTYIRAHASELGIATDFTKHKEIHIHLPEGAIPKDGPSAGITLVMALISAATKKPARGDIAMTGEITLRGQVLPIGGLQEKLLSAKRAGIKAVLIPEENIRSLSEIPSRVTKGLNIIPVSTLDQAIPLVFNLTTKAERLKVAKPKALKVKSGATNRPTPSASATKKTTVRPRRK